jgi:lactoylglutathione lyase
MARARLVGINHVAIEVGDIDGALEFYGRFFEFTLRSRSRSQAFIDIGDQFLALAVGRPQPADGAGHFGLVVDDKEAVRAALEEAGVQIKPGRRLDFRDPWGNQIEVVAYQDIQYTKAPWILDGMGLELEKTETALEELRAKGLDA